MGNKTPTRKALVEGMLLRYECRTGISRCSDNNSLPSPLTESLKHFRYWGFHLFRRQHSKQQRFHQLMTPVLASSPLAARSNGGNGSLKRSLSSRGNGLLSSTLPRQRGSSAVASSPLDAATSVTQLYGLPWLIDSTVAGSGRRGVEDNSRGSGAAAPAGRVLIGFDCPPSAAQVAAAAAAITVPAALGPSGMDNKGHASSRGLLARAFAGPSASAANSQASLAA
jgi:hypothetical protein